MKWPKNKIWYACGIPLVLIGGLFLWLALWANHWENRWESFQREAEAQGEDFTMASFVKPPVPDEENYLEHPWVKSVWLDQRPRGPVAPDNETIDQLLVKIRGEEGEKPQPLEALDEWLKEAKVLLDRYQNDIAGMRESAARPAYWRDLTPRDDIDAGSWFLLQHWQPILELHYRYHAQRNDTDAMIEDTKIFLQMAEHAHCEPDLVTQWLATALRNYADWFIQADLEKSPSNPERNKRWHELLSQQKSWMDDQMITLIRYERFCGLNYLSKEKNRDRLMSQTTHLQDLWQKNLFVKKTLMARNKLAMCEDFQVNIITPFIRKQKVEATNIQDYLDARDSRITQDSLYEKFTLDWNETLTRFLKELKEEEALRNDLIQQLSQSP